MAPGFADRAVQGVNFLPLRLQCCTARRLCAQPGAVDCLLGWGTLQSLKRPPPLDSSTCMACTVLTAD